MADTDVSPQDVQEAARFMQGYLLAKIPDGDFTEGSPLYDHAIQAFAYLFAYLRKQVGVVRARQSLLTLANLPPEESVDDAADAILANLLLARAPGRLARGAAVVHLSQRADVLVPRAARFFKTRAHAFLVDAADDVFVPASDLRPVTGTDGRTASWVTPPLPLVAARPGRDYNQPAGPFVGFTRFHPFATLVENTSDFTGGDGAQPTREFVEGAGSALALRALLNPSSNAAVLRAKFDAEQVVTVGAGAQEMTRDLVTELGRGIALHVGGHMDIYVRRPVRQTVERLVVGAAFARPDGRAVRLTVDPALGVDFTTGAGIVEPVAPGDVLALAAGLPEAPFQFRVVEVEPLALVVSTRAPFSLATDELTPAVPVGFSVGNNYPAFDNKVAFTESVSYATSRSLARSGAVVLEGVPVYRVRRVEIVDATAAALDPYKDLATGTLVFSRRENALPATAPRPGDALVFTVETLNPAEAQSGIGVTLVRVGWPGVVLDGLTAEVTYDTLADFAAIDAYVRSEYERPAAAHTLVKGLHPVYVAFTVPYRLAPQRTDILGAASVAFDEAAAVVALEAFVNAHRSSGGLDQSLLATEARAAAGVEVSVYPFVVRYDLYGPDGKVYRFATEDVATVFPDGTTTARLLNPEDFGLPPTGYHAALRKRLRDLGVSDRTTRFLAAPGAVTFLRRT